MNRCLILFLLFQVIVSFSFKGFLNRTKSVISITIDFIPIVGNLIEITETVTGNDYTIYQIKQIQKELYRSKEQNILEIY